MSYEETRRTPTPPIAPRPSIGFDGLLWIGHAIVLLIVAVVLLAAALS